MYSIQLAPEDTEEYIEYLISVGRLDEAAVKLAQIVNQDDFVSKHGKSNHQLWNELCDLISKNPAKIKSLNVDAIIRGGLRRYTDQLGPLWNSLADYYVRSGLFERVYYFHYLYIIITFYILQHILFIKMLYFILSFNIYIIQARDIYEEAIQTVTTVRDFTQVFDAYAQFEELSLKKLIEEAAKNPTEEGKDNVYINVYINSIC